MNCCCFSLTFVHLQAIFDWNVKQLFLYLSAEYTTKTNVSYLKQKHMPSHQYTSVSLFFSQSNFNTVQCRCCKMPISKPKNELSSYGMLLAYWYKPLIIYMCYICVHTHTKQVCIFFWDTSWIQDNVCFNWKCEFIYLLYCTCPKHSASCNIKCLRVCVCLFISLWTRWCSGIRLSSEEKATNWTSERQNPNTSSLMMETVSGKAYTWLVVEKDWA